MRSEQSEKAATWSANYLIKEKSKSMWAWADSHIHDILPSHQNTLHLTQDGVTASALLCPFTSSFYILVHPRIRRFRSFICEGFLSLERFLVTPFTSFLQTILTSLRIWTSSLAFHPFLQLLRQRNGTPVLSPASDYYPSDTLAKQFSLARNLEKTSTTTCHN